MGRRAEPVERLENLVLSFLSQLSTGLQDSEERARKKDKKRKIVFELADRKKKTSDGSMGVRTLKFPQKTRGASAKPFAQLFRVADLMHEALLDDIPTTKRDMYYKDVQLFKSQSVVDRMVDDLAATFELGRADLHVRASSKGLVCGSGLTIHLGHNEIMSLQDSEGMLIPASEEISRFEVRDGLAWVLVVEKEAVFQTLCRLKLASHPALPGPGIIITGKGYPDVATRQLVKTLSDNLPASIPIVALVDGDAYGIDILSVYKYGSRSMRHESERLAAGRVRWLGIWASELAGLGIDKDALIPMTKHDEKKALSMLRREDIPKKWRKELQYMVHTRRKAEIEILCSVPAQSESSICHPPEDEDMLEDEDDRRKTLHGTHPLRDPPLLQYLVPKISAFVARYAQTS
ncbi:DNA topoisomerase IV alpha subunit [Sparassis latifolia]